MTGRTEPQLQVQFVLVNSLEGHKESVHPVFWGLQIRASQDFMA